MDHSGKKLASGIDFGKTRSNIRFRDPNHDAGSTRGCSRLGCGSNHNSTYGAGIDAEKPKGSVRTSFRTSIRSAFGSSSRKESHSSISVVKSKDKRIQLPASKTAVAESSKRKDLIEEPSAITFLENPEPSPVATSSHRSEVGRDNVDSAGASCGRNVHPETPNQSVRRVRPGGTQNSSSVRNSPVSQVANESFRTRYGPVNRNCRPVSDAVDSGCSSSSASPSNRAADSVRRRYPNAESHRHKFASGSSSSGETSASSTTSNSPPSVIRQSPVQTAAQRGRNRPGSNSSRYRAPPARTPDVTHRREARMRYIELGNDMFSLPEPAVDLQEPRLQSPVSDSAFARSLLSSFAESTPTRPGYSGGSSRGNRGARSRQGVHILEENSGIEFDPYVNRTGHHHHHINPDGIAEVLLALDRIEQDEELSYEQLAMLESNLLLVGFSILDQHRDLRLDIDDMSYEELLALGERMGTVNTALSEEEMSKCLRKSVFKSTLASSAGVDDAKCSICQEEYLAGDEVGKLSCEHLYHVGCIRQWFELKNWCPICKASARSNETTTTHAGRHTPG